ncbi:hypothetical protein H1Q59_08455 [Holosporaceae bacterium 'Namur']|nr:hypothetical protein [Holosporaceae bacterium 'Namur']
MNNVEKYEETSTKDNFISRNSIQQATTPHHPANNTINHSINNTEGINKLKHSILKIKNNKFKIGFINVIKNFNNYQLQDGTYITTIKSYIDDTPTLFASRNIILDLNDLKTINIIRSLLFSFDDKFKLNKDELYLNLYNLIKQDPYNSYYDDSSDEEDDKKIIEYRIEDKAEDINNCEKYEEVSETDIKIAFLIRELSMRILKSKNVNNIYYKLKQNLLFDNTFLDDSELASIITTALSNAANELYKNHSGTVLTKNQRNILNKSVIEVTRKLLENKRIFVRDISQGTLATNPILTDQLYKITIQLPLNKSFITQKDIVNNIIQIYQQIGSRGVENENSKLTSSKRVLNQLTELKSKIVSPFKKIIVDKLLEDKPKKRVLVYAKEIFIVIKEQVINEIGDISEINHQEFIEIFQSLITKALHALNLKINRQNLEASYTFKLPAYSDNFPSALLAAIKLNNRSTLRIIKNRIDQENIFGSESIFVRIFEFKSSSVLTTLKLSTNLVRDGQVMNLSSYPNIGKAIELIKAGSNGKITDSTIAKLMIKTFHGHNILDDLSNIPLNQAQQLQHFINNFVFLLFGFESSRNPACLIIHHMMLDLIEFEHTTWQDMLGLLNMPMSIPDAVSGARSLNTTFSEYTSSRYSYDKSSFSNSDEAKALDILKSELSICKNWFEIFHPKITFDETLDVFDFIDIISDHIKNNWYNFNITAFSREQEERLETLLELGIDKEELYSLEINKLDLIDTEVISSILENTEIEFDDIVSLSGDKLELLNNLFNDYDNNMLIEMLNNSPNLTSALEVYHVSRIPYRPLNILYDFIKLLIQQNIDDPFDEVIELEKSNILDIMLSKSEKIKESGKYEEIKGTIKMVETRRAMRSEDDEFSMESEEEREQELNLIEDDNGWDYDYNSDDSSNPWGYKGDRECNSDTERYCSPDEERSSSSEEESSEICTDEERSSQSEEESSEICTDEERSPTEDKFYSEIQKKNLSFAEIEILKNIINNILKGFKNLKSQQSGQINDPWFSILISAGSIEEIENCCNGKLELNINQYKITQLDKTLFCLNFKNEVVSIFNGILNNKAFNI